MSTDELARRRQSCADTGLMALQQVLRPALDELAKPAWVVPLNVHFCAKDEAEAKARVEEMREYLDFELHILEVEPTAPPELEDDREPKEVPTA